MPNYPWSGKLGRVADKCIYCGTDGPSFRLSSFGDSCLDCHSKTPRPEPIPELKSQLFLKRLRLNIEWCQRNNMDYFSIKKLNPEYLPLFEIATFHKINEKDFFISNHYKYSNGDRVGIFVDEKKVLLTDLGTCSYRCSMNGVPFPEFILGFDIKDNVISKQPGSNIIKDFNHFCEILIGIC